MPSRQDERRWAYREHPSACTCVECSNARLRRLGIKPGGGRAPMSWWRRLLRLFNL